MSTSKHSKKTIKPSILYHKSDYDSSDDDFVSPPSPPRSLSGFVSDLAPSSYASSISSYTPPKGIKVKPPKKAKKKKVSAFDGLSVCPQWSGGEDEKKKRDTLTDSEQKKKREKDSKERRKKKGKRKEKPLLSLGGLEVDREGNLLALLPVAAKGNSTYGSPVSGYGKYSSTPVPKRLSDNVKTVREAREAAERGSSVAKEVVKIDETARLKKQAEDAAAEVQRKVQDKLGKIEKRAREKRNKRIEEARWDTFMNEPLQVGFEYPDPYHIRRPPSPPTQRGYLWPENRRQLAIAPRTGNWFEPELDHPLFSPLQGLRFSSPDGLQGLGISGSGWRKHSQPRMGLSGDRVAVDQRVAQLEHDISICLQDAENVKRNPIISNREKQEQLDQLARMYQELEDKLRLVKPRY